MEKLSAQLDLIRPDAALIGFWTFVRERNAVKSCSHLYLLQSYSIYIIISAHSHEWSSSRSVHHAMDRVFFFISALTLEGCVDDGAARREKHALIITMTRRWACCFFKVATQYNLNRLFFSPWVCPLKHFYYKRKRQERKRREGKMQKRVAGVLTICAAHAQHSYISL